MSLLDEHIKANGTTGLNQKVLNNRNGSSLLQEHIAANGTAGLNQQVAGTVTQPQSVASQSNLSLYQPTEFNASKYQQDIDTLSTSRNKLYNDYDLAVKNVSAKSRMGSSKEEVQAARNTADKLKQQLADLDRQIEEAKTNKWRAENSAKYGNLSANADYATKSKQIDAKKGNTFGVTIGGKFYGTGDDTYAYINNLGGRQEKNALYKMEKESAAMQKYNYMTQEEKDNYNYLYQTEGKKSADDYLNYISYDLDARRTQGVTSTWSQAAKKDPVSTSAFSVVSNLASGIGLADVARQNIERNITGNYKPINYNSAAMNGTFATSGIRGTVAQDINDAVGTINLDEEDHPILSRVFNGKGFGDVYQLGMSMLDSTATALMGNALGVGAAGTLMLGGSAGTQGVLDALERGATDEQALAMGLINGTFEALFEYVSLDKLLTREPKRALLAFMQQGFIEGSEELNTTLFNTLADILVMAENSDYRRSIASYIEQGYSERDAWVRTLEDIAIGMGWDFIGGSVSGGLMGTGYNAIGNISQNRSIRKAYGSELESLVAEALDINPNNEYAKAIQQKIEESKHVSVKEIKNLIQENTKADNRATAEQLLTDYGETDNAAPMADAIARSLNDEKTTRADRRMLKTENATKAMSEIEGNSGVRLEKSDWTEKVRPERTLSLEEAAARRSQEKQTKAVEEFTKNHTPIAPRQAETVKQAATTLANAEIDSIASQYGKQAGAVKSLYNISPVSDMDAFAKALDTAYTIGLNGGNVSAVIGNSLTQVMTENQRRIAYEIGKAARSAQTLNPTGKRQGVLRAKGMSVADINKRFKAGSNQKVATSALRAIAEMTGITIELYDSNGDYSMAQGSFDWSNDVLSIDIASGLYSDMDVDQLSKYVMLRTFTHEFTHFGEKWAPEEYNVLRSAVIEAYSGNEDFDFDYRVKEIMSSQNLEWDMAVSEVIAEAMTDVLPESKFIETLYNKDKSLAQKLIGKLKQFLERIKAYFNNLVSNPSREAQALKVEIGDTIKYMEGIVDKWDAMAAAAVERYNAEEKAPQKATAESITKEGMASVVDSSGKKMFQLRTMKQDVDFYMQDLIDAGLVGEGKPMSKDDLTYLYSSINRVMDYVERHITEIERSEDFRNMDATNRPFLPYKDNSDPHYKMALDYSTLCRKRLLTQAITERLQGALKRALTPVEQVRIRNEIKKLQEEGKKIDVACALCYVEAARLKSPKVINEFLNNKDDSMRNYYSLKNSRFKSEVYQKRLGDWKESKGLARTATKAEIKAKGYSVNDFNKFSQDVRKSYWTWLEQADPETYAAQRSVVEKAEGMDNQEFLNANSLAKMRRTDPDLYDAFIFKVRSATRSKAQEADVPYARGDINKVGNALIEQMNNESGFRHQSWSDFQAMHMLDTIAAIIELSTRGAKVHTYTKVPDMVRFLGETGMAMNMSLIPMGNSGLDENGQLVFDPVEGMPYENMIELRKEFHSTAGNIAIGISDEQIRALLASPEIDYVIPYHTSGLNADMRRRMGIKAWKDYTKWQNESGDGEGPTLAEWFNQKDAMAAADGVAYMVEASKKYLKLCAERGLTPKFTMFLSKNSDGSYSLADDAQNYWKLLIDRKMVDQVTNGIIIQKPVVPKFNVDTMLDILSSEVNSQAAKDAREAEDYIVNKMLNDNSAFSKAELEQARIIRDAAIRLAIEDTTADNATNRVQNQARDAKGNVVVDDDVTPEKVRTTLQSIYDNPKQNLDFTFPVLKETPFVYEYATKIPGKRSFVMYANKAYNAMQSKNSNGHGLGVDGLMEAIENLENPDYILYQSSGDNAGHYVAIVKINGGDGVVAVDIGNYRNGRKGTVNGESGLYDVVVTAYNSLDENAAKRYETFDDYIDELIESNDIVYDKEKDEASLRVAISETLFGRTEDASSEDIIASPEDTVKTDDNMDDLHELAERGELENYKGKTEMSMTELMVLVAKNEAAKKANKQKYDQQLRDVSYAANYDPDIREAVGRFRDAWKEFSGDDITELTAFTNKFSSEDKIPENFDDIFYMYSFGTLAYHYGTSSGNKLSRDSEEYKRLEKLFTAAKREIESFYGGLNGHQKYEAYHYNINGREGKNRFQYSARTQPENGKEIRKALGGTFFSGGGTVDFALSAILDSQFAVEYDAKISAVYQQNNETQFMGKDVMDFNPEEWKGKVEYFHASPVCKTYSHAISNAGKEARLEEGIDAKTAKATANALRVIQPSVFTLENVVGYKGSPALKLITDALDELGYTWDIATYNAADYGAATSRDRVFIRAVKNGELPAKPTKVDKRTSWYDAVSDLIETLPEADTNPRMINSLKNISGIDVENIDKPLFVFGESYKNQEYGHAFADSPLPTIIANSGASRIFMPDGRVLEATPRVLARISGLPDSYKLPNSKVLARTIIGNGVPIKLTQAVVGPLLNQLTEQNVQFQQRTQSYTDREVLEMASDIVDKGSLTDAERSALGIFNQRLEQLNELQEQRDQTQALLKAQTKALSSSTEFVSLRQAEGDILRLASAIRDAKTASERANLTDQRNRIKATASRLRDSLKSNPQYAELNKTKARLGVYSQKIKAAENQLLSIEDKQVLKKVLKQSRKVVERDQRSIIKNRSDVEKYRAKVTEKVQGLNEKLLKNSDKAHVPQALKGPLAEFLTTIDFTSTRKLNGGEETKKDKKYTETLDRVRQVLAGQLAYMNDPNNGTDLGAYVDMPQGFVDAIQEHINKVKAATEGLDITTNEVNMMSAEELQDLDFILTVITHSINAINKLHTAGRFAGISDAATSTITELGKLKADSGKAETVRGFLEWKNTLPYYAFKRYGDAGQQIFEGLQDGWDKMAFNVQQIKDFAEKAYKADEAVAWSNKLNTIELDGDRKVQMTTAQIMSLYCLNKREQARQHLHGGGMRVGNIDIKKGIKTTPIRQTTPVLLNDADVLKIVSKLSARQLEVADKLQGYMNTVGSDWGNAVSMERFGYKSFEEQNYFPIKSDSTNLPAIDPDAKANDMFRLLNLSMTKALNPKANNALVVNDIFDVFATHMSDMAKYNALALPILDAMKWYNYKDTDKNEDGQITTATVQRSVERAYGREGGSYYLNFMKDLNGAGNGGRDEGTLNSWMSNYKVAAVAANLRVALLQPTAYFRASAVLSPSVMAKAVTMSGGTKEMLKYSGIAVWKDLGFFDTNIGRNVTDLIKHDESIKDKIVEKSLAAAELGDKVTWGIIWNACKLDQKSKGVKKEELMQATAKRFREVIYRTQVVDSTLTRTQLMRDKSALVKNVTGFMSEPSLSYNLLLDAYESYSKEAKLRGKAAAWAKTGNLITRAIGAYAVSQIAAAIAESVADAFRDDDDYEKFLQKWGQAFWADDDGKWWEGNLVSDLNPLSKLPLVKDVFSVISGYESTDMTMQWLEDISNLKDAWKSEKRPLYGKIYKTLQTASRISGLPMSNATREVATIWNNTLGVITGNKLRTYDPGKKTAIKEAYTSGRLTEDKAKKELVDKVGLSEEDASKQVAKWKYADFDTNGGGVSQDEVSYGLEAGDYTQAEKEAIWSELGYKKDYADVQEKAQARVELDKNAVTYNSANWEDGLKDKTLPDSDKDTLVNAYGSTWFAAPYKNLRAVGYSPKDAYDLLISMDADENHSIKQGEAFAVLNTMPDDYAAALWDAFGWKTNYYTYKAKH